MTQDHLFLVMGTDGYDVYVYKHNGTQFNHFQNFTYSHDSYNWVSITDDHQYLTVSHQNAKEVHRYYYNKISGKF